MSHKEMVPTKAKTLISVAMHHMMSVDVPWRNTPQNFNKGMQNLGKSKFITLLQIEANTSKNDE